MTGLRLAPLRGGWAGPSQDRQKDRPKTHRSPLSRAKQEPLVSQPPSLAAGTRSTQLSWFRENYRDRRPPPRARRGATPACRASRGSRPARRGCGRHRSEEHTSELQSLMRISYAVFCLKKKKTNTYHIHTYTSQLPRKS